MDFEPDGDETSLTGQGLLDYVGFLECELESLKHWGETVEQRHDEEKRRLKERLEAALDKFDDAQHQIYSHRHESLHAERLLHEERIREKVLEERVKKLEHDLETKNDLIVHRRKRDERARRQLEKENELLKKKVTLGWMLGCLSEVYLQSDQESVATPLLKMVRNIQRELEREGVLLSYANGPPNIQLEYVENEIRRLIDCARWAENGAQPSLASNRKYLEGDVNDTRLINQRIKDEGSEGFPSARYVVNCFNNGLDGTEVATDARPAQIEVFEVTPTRDLERARLSGSTWAEVKVMDRDKVNMHRTQMDIKMMLSKLQATLDQYLASTSAVMPPPVSPTTTSQSRSLSKLLRSPKKNRATSRNRSLSDSMVHCPKKNCGSNFVDDNIGPPRKHKSC